MANRRESSLAVAVAALIVLSFVAPSMAAEPAPAPKPADLWKAFIHAVNIAQPVVAKSYAEKLLDNGVAPREIYLLSQDTVGVNETLKRAARLDGMEDVVGRLRSVLQTGLRAQASDPAEIARAISMLSGTLEQFHVGQNLLILSGEYALPQLIDSLKAPDTTENVRERIVAVLPKLGLVSVRGLTAALQSDNPIVQEACAEALGRIQYIHASAGLKELSAREGVLARVRDITIKALANCAGEDAPSMTVSQVAYSLAVKYYKGAESLLPDPGYDTANIWSWQADTGLTYTPAPRSIFLDIYTMRLAKMALASETEEMMVRKSASLWLAANLRKESHLGPGEVDPTHDANAPGAGYYTLAAGPRYVLDVLARGLADNNSAVSIGAIEALARTSTAESLVQSMPNGQPLVEALRFPDRHVRFLAAVSLGDALPRAPFEGAESVVTVLNEALRQTGSKVALLVMSGAEGNEVAEGLRKAGYDLIAGPDANNTLAAGRAAGAVDLVVLGPKTDPGKLIVLLREDHTYAVAPIVVMAKTIDLKRLARKDGRVVLAADSTPDAIVKAAEQALTLGVGRPLTDEQADAWAIRSAGTIRLLGLTETGVYDLKRTAGSLAAIMAKGKDSVKVAAAGALAVIKSPQAQSDIGVLACSDEADEAVRIKAFGSLTESLRRFRTLLDKQDIEAIAEVVSGDGSLALRDAAAQAMGAMTSEQVKPLILDAR